MCSLESYKIDLKALEEGVTTFDYSLDDEFFRATDTSEVKGGKVEASLSIRKNRNFFDLRIHTEGTVTVACNICLDDMELPVMSDNRIMVKLDSRAAVGMEEPYDGEGDDLVTVDEDEGVLDTSWLIYESIELAIPIRHVHAPGQCNPDMMRALEEHSATRKGEEEETETDPRWSELLKLKE